MTARRCSAAAALASALLAACSVAPPQAPPVTERVTVEQGELLGVTDRGVLRWQGIPYAAPPVGELRWRAPRPPGPWTDARSATAAGDRCAQQAPPPGTPHANPASRSEDCLTLNVTVPAGTTAASRLPVLVWVHGGGFSAGAGSDVDPRRLVLAGPLITVTINYRLGVLGFLGLPDLPDSGSFGLLDQQQALRWVQRNIAVFGGDPDQVTLAGESAGADSVCAQITSPGAIGLFRRAILQSGGCGTANVIEVIRPGAGQEGDTWKPLPVAEAAGKRVAAGLGCPDPATAPDCLRALPVERLMAAGGTYWSPAVHTPTLPRRPSELIAAPQLRPTPILAGTTRDEGTLFTDVFFDRAGEPLSPDRFADLLAQAAGRRAADAAMAYPLADRSPGRVWSDVITDRAYACTALNTYRAVGGRAPLFAYEFADPTAPATFDALPPHLADGVTHGAEVAYLLDLLPGQPTFTPAQKALADELVRAWARFVTTGDPNGDTDPRWPRWTGDGEIRTFTTGPQAETTRTGTAFGEAHRCALWNG